MDPEILAKLNWATLSHVALILLFLVFIVQNYKKVSKLIRPFFSKEQPDGTKSQENTCDRCAQPNVERAIDGKKAESTIRQFVKASMVPTIFINFEHEIIAINDDFEKLTGYTDQEIVGLDLSVIVPDRWCHMHSHFVKEYLDGVEHDYNIRIVNKTRPIEVKTKDGNNIKVMLKVNLIANGVRGFLGFMQKIDE